MNAAYYIGNRSFQVEACRTGAPQYGEISLEVAYCGICGTDTHIFHGAMDQRVQMPQVIGHEASARISAIGSGVSGFSVGDAVVVRPLDHRAETPADRGYSHICKGLNFIGIDSPGAFQAKWNVPAFTVHKVPEGIDLKLAALCEPLAVACHDVRIGAVQEDELVVVIGGGPIGMLVAMVARAAGARVILSEINESRLEFARGLGFEAVSPVKTNLTELCLERSDGSGADVVFEVSGARAAAATMTDLLAIRGRIVLVAIYPKPVELNLFQFFWKELKLCGARVYEPEDYEKALQLLAAQSLPLEAMITRVAVLSEIQSAFEALDATPDAMKVIIDCQA